MSSSVILKFIFSTATIYQLLVTLIIYSSITIIRTLIIRQRRYQLFKYYGIPGPEPSIIDGNYLSFCKEFRKFEVEGKMEKVYGPTYGYFFGDVPMIYTSDVDILRRVFLEDFETFSERNIAFMDIIITYGILFCKRPKWKLFRKSLTPAFAKYHARGNSSTLFIEDTTNLLTNYIDQKLDEADRSNQTADIDLFKLMKAAALHIISKLALHIPNVEVKEGEDHVEGIDSFTKAMSGPLMNLSLTTPALKDILTWFSNIGQRFTVMSKIYKSLDARLDEGFKRLKELEKNGPISSAHDRDLLDIFIRLLYEGKITYKEALGNAETLLFAGYDTSATSLIYTLWCLAKYPDIQERVREEVMTRGVESSYLLQVIQETMRLYPVSASFITRIATKTVVINGLTIPEGSQIIYNSYNMHRSTQFWTDPEKFDPDRFRSGVEIHPLSYAPFGLGERRCPGYRLALLEMKIVLCEILIRYRVVLKSPMKLNLQDFALSLTRPSEKIRFELVRLDTEKCKDK